MASLPMLLLLGSAAAGAFALVLGVRLLWFAPKDRATTRTDVIVGVACLAFALGIGVCHGIVMYRLGTK